MWIIRFKNFYMIFNPFMYFMNQNGVSSDYCHKSYKKIHSER